MSSPRIHEVWADEIVSPTTSGGFRRFSPGSMVYSPHGKILSVSSISKSKLNAVSRKVYRARLVTPGFVDAHTHLVFAGNRADEWNLRLKGWTYQEIAERGGGIQKSVASTRESKKSELLSLAKRRSQVSLSFGVTTIEVKSGYGLDLESEMKILDVISELKASARQSIFTTFMAAHTLPKNFSRHSDFVDYLIQRVLPKVAGRADFQDVFCEKGYFSARDSLRLLNAGKKLGLKPKVHAHEFGRTGGVDVAIQAGAVSADHLMVLSNGDIRGLKRASVIPVVLPGTSFFLGAKCFAPARKMWDAGLRVAIASDFNPGTNPTLNLPLIGTFAAVHQSLNLEEILTAQTYHGALALGLRDRGRLAPGMRADFCTWDLQSFEEIYYSYGNSRVASAYLGGKKVL